MKSSNAPFNEFGQSMILRDIEDLYIGLNSIGSQLNQLSAVVAGIYRTVSGLSGLGTMAYQNANAVAITGGTVDGLSSLTTPATATVTLLGASGMRFGSDTTSARLTFGATTADLRGGDAASFGVMQMATTFTSLGFNVTASGGSQASALFTASGVTVATVAAVSISGNTSVQLASNLSTVTVSSTGTALFAAGGTFIDLKSTTRLMSGATVWGLWDTSGIIIGGSAIGPTTSSLTSSALRILGNQVVGARQAAITGPSGGATIDSQARTAINTIIGVLQTHGLTA